jgi:DNA-binding transcriptional ArsR family regulator
MGLAAFADELADPRTAAAVNHPTVGLDDVVHQRVRLGLLTVLCEEGEVDFGLLREVLDLTAGNLNQHLRVLEDAGLVAIAKGYRGRRPRTTVRVTAAGRRAYDREIAALRTLVAAADHRERVPPRRPSRSCGSSAAEAPS